MKTHLLNSLLVTVLASRLLAEADDAPNLQSLIDQARPGGVVEVPAGTWEQALVITGPLTLKGQGPDVSILKLTSDQPLVWIKSQEPVHLEGLKLVWQRATSEKGDQPPCAVRFRDARVTIRNCHLVAAGGSLRCPSAVSAMGFSELELDHCRFDGFEYTIQIWEGGRAQIVDCVVRNPGHCGITVGREAEADVRRNVVTGSGYHGIRCTGGTLRARDNLVVRNNNRGFYLGNRTGKGEIVNNLILKNGSGISGFAGANYLIANNVIADSTYAGLDSRYSCRIKAKDNVICGNARGFAAYEEGDVRRFTLARNLFWDNKTESENADLPSETLRVNPGFKNATEGDFTLTLDNPEAKTQGLKDSDVIRSLWQTYADLKP